MKDAKPYITNELFDAFLSCTYKSYLLLSDVDGQTTEYAVLDSRLNEEFRVEAKRRLLTIEKNVPPIGHHCIERRVSC